MVVGRHCAVERVALCRGRGGTVGHNRLPDR